MIVSSKFMLLKELKVLQSLENEEIDSLARVVDFHKMSKGMPIYQENGEIENIYILYKGVVKLGMKTVGEREIIRGIIHPGEIFGENIFAGQFRKEFAVSLEEVHIFSIPVAYFQELIQSNVSFREQIIEMMMLNVSQLQKRIHNFMYLNAQKRIINFLKGLTETIGQQLANGEYLVKHNLNHLAIANSTDTSRQTVARVLNELKANSIISYSDRRPSRIIVKSLESLT